MALLGIETSCDETSVAVVERDGTVRSNLIASQVARHQPFGGVVPEIASREHLRQMMPLARQALSEASLSLSDLDGIGVTSEPGLIGALLVGVAAAQGMSYGSGLPLIPVNHLEGHLFSPWLRLEGPADPRPDRFLSLVVSGGHSSIYDVTDGRVVMRNRTRDDAAGEVFDKVAKFIGLPYPGGPHIERIGASGDPLRFAFSLARFKDDSVDFSFSGLKSTAIRLAREQHLESLGSSEAQPPLLADFCASFQKAIGDQVLDRLDRVWSLIEREGGRPLELGFAGGVAANGELRRRVSAWGEERDIVVRAAERKFCTDNAAMIAFAGWQKWDQRQLEPLRVRARSRAPAGSETSAEIDRPN